MCGETRIPRDMCAGNTHPWETHITMIAVHSKNRNLLQTHEGLLENKTIRKVQVYDDTYPMKHIGKTTDTFRSLNFRLPQNSPL